VPNNASREAQTTSTDITPKDDEELRRHAHALKQACLSTEGNILTRNVRDYHFSAEYHTQMKLHSDALNSGGQRLSALRDMFLFSPSHSKKVAKHYLKLGHEDVRGKKGMSPRIFNLSVT
jgi:hypothetical protein